MSEENLAIVRQIYRAWKNGSPVSSGLLAEDIEWVNSPDAVEPGTRRGLAAFIDAAATVGSAFPDVRVHFEDLIDAGDKVVVLGTLRGTGSGSGVVTERRQGYVWTLRDGLAVRFEWFNDPADALAAGGVGAKD